MFFLLENAASQNVNVLQEWPSHFEKIQKSWYFYFKTTFSLQLLYFICEGGFKVWDIKQTQNLNSISKWNVYVDQNDICNGKTDKLFLSRFRTKPIFQSCRTFYKVEIVNSEQLGMGQTLSSLCPQVKSGLSWWWTKVVSSWCSQSSSLWTGVHLRETVIDMNWQPYHNWQGHSRACTPLISRGKLTRQYGRSYTANISSLGCWEDKNFWMT